MSTKVCELVFYWRIAIIACVLCFSQYALIRSLRSPDTNWTSDDKLCRYIYVVFIIQIYSHTENTSQISNCSTKVLGSFPKHLLTPNNIPT